MLHSAISKLILVPVGLPGIGKSTLAKNLKFSIERYPSYYTFPAANKLHLRSQLQQKNEILTGGQPPYGVVDQALLSLLYGSSEEDENGADIAVKFKSISYDTIIGD